MFGFKSKAQKMREQEELRLQGIEAQREKEMQARISVKRTLSSMKKQSAKLEAFKKEYIEWYWNNKTLHYLLTHFY